MDERKELEDLYNADTVESRAFRLDWTRVTNKPKVKAYLTRMCNTDELFTEVRGGVDVPALMRQSAADTRPPSLRSSTSAFASTTR